MKMRRPAPAGPVLNQLTRRQFGLQRGPDRGRRRGLRRRAILFNLLALDLLHRRAVAQSDAPRLRADLDDLEVVFLARLEWPGTLQRPGCWTEARRAFVAALALLDLDRKSTRLNSSHRCISYAVFCLQKKNRDGRSRL